MVDSDAYLIILDYLSVQERYWYMLSLLNILLPDLAATPSWLS